MDIALGSDHAGYELKLKVRAYLLNLGHTVADFGTHTSDSMDYPDVAHPVASSVENKECEFGILLCGSANGVAMTANKHAGIRAALRSPMTTAHRNLPRKVSIHFYARSFRILPAAQVCILLMTTSSSHPAYFLTG